MPKTIVIIDSSYYNFYRFFATISWYNYSPERRAEAEGVAWLDNPSFMKTYEKMWFENIKKISKKFGVQTKDLIFARDGKKVWRYAFYPEYKATRAGYDADDLHSPYPVFGYTKQNFYPRLYKEGAAILYVDRAEGDDIAAIATRYIRTVFPDTKVVIITGDHDFLQLSDPNHVELYQLKGFKQITTADPHTALMTKILAGDPSDNIPAIYKGCGKKTAARLANNPAELEEMLQKKGREQYELNRQLVDFDYIPKDLVEEIEDLLDEFLV